MIKVSDIEKLTYWGNYTADLTLKRLSTAIQEWQEEDGLNLCPDFQRGHVWTAQQQVDFVEYILRDGQTSPILFNNRGSFVIASKDFVCVDGLQRLTALLLFLDNKLSVFGGHTRSQIEGIDIHLSRLHLNFRINELMTEREVIQWYLELNFGGTPHTQVELDRVRGLLEIAKVN